MPHGRALASKEHVLLFQVVVVPALVLPAHARSSLDGRIVRGRRVGRCLGAEDLPGGHVLMLVDWYEGSRCGAA